MPRYVIRVNYPNGAVAWLRHGARTLEHGPIVRFRSKRDADINLDFIKEGLDAGTTATVVKVAEKPAKAPEVKA
jgi:hypothetical protein